MIILVQEQGHRNAATRFPPEIGLTDTTRFDSLTSLKHAQQSQIMNSISAANDFYTLSKLYFIKIVFRPQVHCR